MGSRRDFLIAATAGVSSIAASGAPPLAPPDKQPPKLSVPSAPARKVGFAIVGLGELALDEIMPAFGECTYAKPVALVSGHRAKAEKVAATYGIATDRIYDYATYDQLADAADVDAIYVVLPNSMHSEFTIRGFHAGKHVLCEKPMAVTSAEAEKMLAAGKQANKLLMIAYRLHYEPMTQKLMELTRGKTLGAVKTISATNAQNVEAPNIRLSRQLGGGPVGDIGIYCINAARYTTHEEPVSVFAEATQPKDDPRFREVPETVSFVLKFPSGAQASCTCSFGSGVSRQLRAHCADGYVDLENAFAYCGLKLRTSDKGTTTQHKIDEVNQFAAEMDHFARCILEGSAPRTAGEEGLRDMRIIEAIATSVKTAKAVKIG